MVFCKVCLSLEHKQKYPIAKRMRQAFILVFNLLMLTSLPAQQDISEKLYESTCIQFRGSTYVSGYEQNGNELLFKLKKYSPQLEKNGESSKSLGNHKYEEYHKPVFDTTHGFLSVILQEKNNDKTATLVRFNENLKP